jgi:hypothetical protein
VLSKLEDAAEVQLSSRPGPPAEPLKILMSDAAEQWPIL